MDIESLAPSAEIVSLLTECGLPVADIHAGSPVSFFGVRRDGLLQGTIGLELFPPVALLRSLAVCPAARKRGLGGQLLAFAEKFARGRGVDTLYLLTTNAGNYFLQRGYTPAVRATAPDAIQKTSQFAALCPATSLLLFRSLQD